LLKPIMHGKVGKNENSSRVRCGSGERFGANDLTDPHRVGAIGAN
jgi:hypothetical protein